MVNWEYISVDTDSMEDGKFYSIYTNSNNATLVVPKENQDAVNDEVTALRSELNTLRAEFNQLKENPTTINNYSNCGTGNQTIGGYTYIYDIHTQKVVARMYSYSGIVIMEYLIDETTNEWQEMVRWS